MGNRISTDTGQLGGPVAFFGAAPVNRQTALTAEPTAAPAGGTGNDLGAYDNSTNRDTMITCVNGNRTRCGEIETALKNLGILPA